MNTTNVHLFLIIFKCLKYLGSKMSFHTHVIFCIKRLMQKGSIWFLTQKDLEDLSPPWYK